VIGKEISDRLLQPRPLLETEECGVVIVEAIRRTLKLWEKDAEIYEQRRTRRSSAKSTRFAAA